MAILKPIDDRAKLQDLYKLPRLDGQNLFEVQRFFKRYNNIEYCAIERPGEFTKNLLILVRQHREYAELRTLATLSGFTTVDVKPYEWKQYYGLSKDKSKSIDLANDLIEDLPRLRLQDNDLAEACLIGLYAWLHIRYTQGELI